MLYTVRPPFFYRVLYNEALFRVKETEQELFLTFDDGPIPGVTDWVLDELKKHNAKATFFCIGKNVKANPELFERIKAEGHSVGNHTYNHISGWKSKLEEYTEDVKQCDTTFEAKLFRPPYGRIKPKQFKAVTQNHQVVFWDVISGDFDPETSKEKCLENVLKNTRDGSIIVLHDSLKASERMKYILPIILEKFQGYRFSAL